MDELSKQARPPTATSKEIDAAAQGRGRGRTGKATLLVTLDLEHGIVEEIGWTVRRGSPRVLDLGGGDTSPAEIMAVAGRQCVFEVGADILQCASAQGRPPRSRHAVERLGSGRRPTDGRGGP